jgi:hypothetical protein
MMVLVRIADWLTSKLRTYVMRDFRVVLLPFHIHYIPISHSSSQDLPCNAFHLFHLPLPLAADRRVSSNVYKPCFKKIQMQMLPFMLPSHNAIKNKPQNPTNQNHMQSNSHTPPLTAKEPARPRQVLSPRVRKLTPRALFRGNMGDRSCCLFWQEQVSAVETCARGTS